MAGEKDAGAAAPGDQAGSVVPTAESAAAVVADAGASAAAPAGEAPAAPVAAEAKPEPSLLEAADTAALRKDKTEPKAEGDKTPATQSPAAKAEGDKPAPSEAAKTDAKPDGETAKTEAKADVKPEAAKEPAKDEAKKPETKPDPAKDATAETPPPAPIKYEAFKVPEDVKLDPARVEKLTGILGELQVPQEKAQNLVDLHLEEMRNYDTALRAQQRTHWNNLIDGWKTDLRKDPDLGGNRLETSLAIAKAVVEEYGGSAEQQADFWRHVGDKGGNGMGNYVGLVRILHNIGQALNVFEDGIVPANPSPPKVSGSRRDRWYGSTSQGNGAAKP